MFPSSALFVFIVASCIRWACNREIKKVQVYGTEGESFGLHCKNETEGVFKKLAWLTSAHGMAKDTAFSYDQNEQSMSHANFRGRIRRVDDTSIIISNARKDDSGIWECNIIFDYQHEGIKSRRVQVLALYDVQIVSPPIISKLHPAIVAAPQNFQGSAFCEGHGQYPFNLTWRRINGVLSDHVTLIEKDWTANEEYHRHNQIFFNNLTKFDIGTYLCVAKNFAGQVSGHIEVKLQARPQITNQHASFLANINEEGRIKCSATGQPKVSYTWVFRHNYEKLILKSGENRDNKFIVSKTRFTYYDGKESSVSTLFIKGVQREDWGSYKCLVENSIGYTQKSFTFKGYDKPFAPDLLHTEDIKATQITLHWLLDSTNGEIESVIIKHKRLFDYEWNRLEIFQSLRTYTVIDLEESTTYEFQIQARNKVGVSKPSATMSFTTKIKVKQEAKKRSKEKMIGNLDMVTLVAICGGVIVLLTCLFAVFCFIMKDKKYKKRNKERQNDASQSVPLNRTNSINSTTTLHMVSTINR